MDIEIIPTEKSNPLKKLNKFLKDNIYNKLSKQDLKELNDINWLGTSLDKAISDYKNSCIIEALETEREKNKLQIKGYQEKIERLRDGKENNRYRENRNTGGNVYHAD
jgi:hypothetical protein